MKIQDRIKQIRKALKMSQNEFGASLDVGGNYIYMLESGTRKISKKMIKNICISYHVNEEWFRTGKGEMFTEQPLEKEISELTRKLVNYGSDSFRARFISAISKLDENGWAVLEKLAADMNAEKNDSE